jgi:DNA polymerase III subunit delta'
MPVTVVIGFGEVMAFQEVVGHRRMLSLLSRAIARDTLTPSLVLSGPEGVGKRLTAMAIAQTLNCTSVKQTPRGVTHDSNDPGSASGLMLDACGKCSSCLRIVRGAHPDVETIEPGENNSIKIDQVRQAIERAVFRPFEGRRRVTIIDQADALVAPAQNALLKTLEEPLPASVFILVTSRPDTLLPTVRSRCAVLRFGRLQVAEVAEVLERREGYSHADALAAAAASDGSVRRALDIEAGEFSDARTDAEDLLQVAGRDPRTRLEHGKDLLKGGGAASLEREHLTARLQALGSVLRDLGLLASGADARLLANLDRRPALDALSKSLGGDRVERAFNAVTRAQEALDRNVSPKVVADWLAINVH